MGKSRGFRDVRITGYNDIISSSRILPSENANEKVWVLGSGGLGVYLQIEECHYYVRDSTHERGQISHLKVASIIGPVGMVHDTFSVPTRERSHPGNSLPQPVRELKDVGKGI